MKGGGVGDANPDDYMEALRALGLGEEDLAAWRQSGLAEEAFEDWLTDRRLGRSALADPEVGLDDSDPSPRRDGGSRCRRPPSD
jgi:hypothetical protein